MNFKIDWMDGWGNNPLICVVDAPYVAPPENNVWEKRGDGLHRQDTPSTVRYFFTDGKPTDGYGGATFEGVLTDGTPFKYKGAWSSRAAYVNDLWPESPIVDVVWDHYATAIKVETLVDWWIANQPADWGLAVVDDNDLGPIVLPTREGRLKNKPRGGVLCRLTPDNKQAFMEAFKV